MKVDERQVADILKTLPVGFYLGSRAEVVLDMDASTSFVSMQERNIHVAFRNVARALAGMPKGADVKAVECAIRAQLYHETAHLMLTPGSMYPLDHRNICEDARIETLLRNRFVDTDFDAALKTICGYDPATWRATDALQFLFGIVRFRNGPADLIAEFDGIVRKYAAAHVDGCALACDYDAFARKCFDRWNENPNPAPNPQREDANGGKGQENSGSESGSTGNAENAEGKAHGENAGSDGAGNEKDADGENGSAGSAGTAEGEEGTESDENAEAEKAGAANASGNGGVVPKELTGRAPELSEEEFKKAGARLVAKMNKNADAELDAAVERLIYRATRRRSNKSAAQYGYAGTVDPFAVACRQDFRWLTKRGDGNKGFDRIHLRLWVDVSGSFARSIPNLNRLVSAVIRAERKMPDALAVSVIQMSDDVRKADRAKELQVEGSNWFHENAGVCKADADTRKPGWRTVNVCVWDGSMTTTPYSDAANEEIEALRKSPEAVNMAPKEWGRKVREIQIRNNPGSKRAFDVLNTKDTVIVSDDSNEGFLDAGCPKARKEYVREDYAEHFVDAVLRTLGRVL